MDRPRALVLLLALLTLCITAGAPEVWVQVQMEATKSPSFTVRCGFLGSSSISLVTVSCGGPDGAGGTKLAVLHPVLGTQQWPPVHQVHWETRTSISLTLEGSEGRCPSLNTTFCCKFTSFPEGSQETCRHHHLGTDQGGADEEQGPGKAGRTSGHWPPIWSVTKPQPPLRSPLTQTRARAASQASLSSHHIPYATTTTNYFCPAALDMVLPPQPLSKWTPIPTHTARQPVPWASPPPSAHSSFISVENVLYVQAGERPPDIYSNIIPSPDPLGPRSMKGHLGVQ
ncbi:transmembrane protein PVRIG isoform X2 [Saccopteryx leptura]|uniref:transmembrane protein PVRIG isoform X2 n=1 Tax=Saccopteryx leptura TaxID=249018 RepID=UPI00339BE1B3